MTDEEVIRILAEREGWEPVCHCGDTMGHHHMGGNEHSFVAMDEPPDYPQSLDAIRPVLPKLSEKEWRAFHLKLTDMRFDSPEPFCYSATKFYFTLPPSTLAHAIAEAIEKAKTE